MPKKPNAGQFKPGHQLWRRRQDPVKPLRFKTPDELLDSCLAYLDWLEANPLREEKVFAYQGEITKAEVSKMRMPTIEGLCAFIGICKVTWYVYAKRPKFAAVTAYVDSIIWDCKMTGAAAGLLDAMLVARHLGIAEKRDLSSTDGTMSPPKVIKLTPKSCE